MEVVIQYSSRHLLERERVYSTVEKETLAVVHAVKTFRTYLWGRNFKLFVDHKPLEQVFSKSDPTMRIGRWALLLQEYDFHVIYRKGSENGNADGLSRIPEPEDDNKINKDLSADDSAGLPTEWNPVNAINTEDNFLPDEEEIIKEQKTDAFCIEIAREYKKKSGIKKIDYKKGLLRLNDKIIVPKSLIKRIMLRYHQHFLMGHLGTLKTTKRITAQYIWPQMTEQIANFVTSCITCSKRKAYGAKSAPLKPIDIQKYPFQMVSLDLVGPLIESYKSNRYIMVISEFVTRYLVTVPLPNKETKTIAEAFIQHIILKFGNPTEVLSDGGLEFESTLMHELCKLLNIRKIKTVFYKASTNGLTEKANGVIVNMLANILTDKDDKHNWCAYLDYVTFAYNTSYHASLKNTPHFLLYGSDPVEPDMIFPPPINRLTYRTNEEHIKRWMNAREEAKISLSEAQSTQKKYYDEGKAPKHFNIGDEILLKEMRLRSKLEPKWIGPYKVMKKLSELNYSVREMNKMSEQVVHVNRMKLLKPREIDDIKEQDKVYVNPVPLQSHTDQELSIDEPLREMSPTFDELQVEDPEVELIPDSLTDIPSLSTENGRKNQTTIPLAATKEKEKEVDRSKLSKHNLRSRVKKPDRYGE